MVSAPPVQVFPFRRAPSARRFRPFRAVFPFRRAPSARRFHPARAIFPLRRALFARRSRLSVRFPVASCVTRSASLPVRPVSRSSPFRASCAPFFLSFAGYYCTRRTSLLFGGLEAELNNISGEINNAVDKQDRKVKIERLIVKCKDAFTRVVD